MHINNLAHGSWFISPKLLPSWQTAEISSHWQTREKGWKVLHLPLWLGKSRRNTTSWRHMFHPAPLPLNQHVQNNHSARSTNHFCWFHHTGCVCKTRDDSARLIWYTLVLHVVYDTRWQGPFCEESCAKFQRWDVTLSLRDRPTPRVTDKYESFVKTKMWRVAHVSSQPHGQQANITWEKSG